MNNQIERAQELLSRLQEILRDGAINALVKQGYGNWLHDREDGGLWDVSSLEKARNQVNNLLEYDGPALKDAHHAVLFDIKKGRLGLVVCHEGAHPGLKASIMEFEFLQESIIEDMIGLGAIQVYRDGEFGPFNTKLGDLASVTTECVELILLHNDWEAGRWASYGGGKITIFNQDPFFPEILFNIRRVNFLLSQILDSIGTVGGAETVLVGADRPAIVSPTRQEKPQENDQPQPNPIRWIAPDNAFADLIVELRKKGYIAAGSDMEALEMAAPHFENVNKDPRVLIQGLSGKTANGGRDFEDIPPCKDIKPDQQAGNFSTIPAAKKRRKERSATK